MTQHWKSFRIIKQFSNVYSYFVKELLKQNTFKGKNGVGSTDRYQRISKLLKKKLFCQKSRL